MLPCPSQLQRGSFVAFCHALAIIKGSSNLGVAMMQNNSLMDAARRQSNQGEILR